MAAQTAATTTRESLGSVTLLAYTFTSLADQDTFASGLSTNIITGCYWANGEVDEATAGDEGVSVSNSSGTFTFFKKTAGAATLFVLARV